MTWSTAGTFGPEALVKVLTISTSTAYGPLTAPAVSAPAGYTATVASGNLTVTGPVADGVTPFVVTDGATTLATLTLNIRPASAEMDSRLTTAQTAATSAGTTASAAATSAGAASTSAAAAQTAASAAQTAATATATAATGVYAAQFVIAGDLAVGRIFPAGIRMDYTDTIAAVVANVIGAPMGADLILEFVTEARLTGVKTSRGTATITDGASRRCVITLGTPWVAVIGDRYNVNVNQVGSVRPGSTLNLSVLGPNTTAPVALTRPLGTLTLTAATTGADVTLTWTMPASPGVTNSFVVSTDGAVLATDIDPAVRTYVDVGAGGTASVYTVRSQNIDAISLPRSVSYAPSGTVSDVGEWGSAVANASGLSITVTATAAVAAGRRAFLTIATGSPATGTTQSVFTATDTKGNTWTQDAGTFPAGSGEQVFILSTPNTNGLAIGDGVTATLSGAVPVLRMAAAGRASTALLLDVTAVGGSSTASRNFAVGPTTAPALTGAYALVAYSTLPGTVSLGNLFNAGTPIKSSAGTNDRQVSAGWRILPDVSAVNSTATSSASSAYASVVAVYRPS